MKLSDYRETYYWYSGKASDVSRHLTFAGIAIIWIFKTGNNTDIKIPQALIAPLTLFSIALASDLIQYITGTIIWGSFHRYHEKKGTESTYGSELTSSKYLTWPINLFFIIKISAVLMAYWLLIKYFGSSWLVPVLSSKI